MLSIHYVVVTVSDSEILWCENKDLDEIFTPVDVNSFTSLLRNAGYDEQKTRFIEQGFSQGFSLNYQGPKQVKRRAKNLKLRVGSKTELWNKILKEVQAKRVAGPFEEIPFDYYIKSPVGLVPKDGSKTRLIFHLSYPKDGESVNSGIPQECCTVKYPDFSDAVRLCLRMGKNCRMGKSDFSSAFRHAPLRKSDWKFLIMMAEHPVTGKVYFFVDKCLPFGSSISCVIFQAISDAIAFVVSFQTEEDNINYLDDFLFAVICEWLCNAHINKFLEICKQIRFPIAMEKTVWGTLVLIFLGMLLDAEHQIVAIPLEKIEKANELIDVFLDSRKVTLLQIQKLAGF